MLYSSAPRDTVAYWTKGTPLAAHLDRSGRKAIEAAKAIGKTGWFGTTLSPDQSAARFYLLNHAAAHIAARRDPLEPLPPGEVAVLETYAKSGAEIAMRLFSYVFLITAREARHNHTGWEAGKQKVCIAMQETYPDLDFNQVQQMYAFLKGFPDSSTSALTMMLNVPPHFNLGPLCKLMSVVYYKCSWGSAYGGPKWGNIADALYAFVSGEWSAEMFADTAFTLAHNTAPIFNKGMLYAMPSGKFITLLDVQRAGMVPVYLKTELTNLVPADVALVHQHLPELFEGEVDWGEVQKLGAVGYYGDKVKAKPPKGCQNKKIKVDHNHEVWVLEARAA